MALAGAPQSAILLLLLLLILLVCALVPRHQAKLCIPRAPRDGLGCPS
ncbi:MAG: hypothetical protein JWP03_4051 [Phycisphaerales bacterium]|nr:hypothetical protein [Phycisphaerales bacterium]